MRLNWMLQIISTFEFCLYVSLYLYTQHEFITVSVLLYMST